MKVIIPMKAERGTNLREHHFARHLKGFRDGVEAA